MTTKSSLILIAAGVLGISTQALADARGELMAAFEATMAKKSYSASSIAEYKGRSTQSRIQVQLPGSFHIKSDESEFIVLPSGTWMNAGGQWMELPMDVSKMIQGISLQAMKDGASMVQSVEVLPDSIIEGCNTKTYAYRVSGKMMGIPTDADVQTSVCEDTGLPIRVVSADPKGKTRTTITYDFDAPVDIRAPN